jgi:hypothetical protein
MFSWPWRCRMWSSGLRHRSCSWALTFRRTYYHCTLKKEAIWSSETSVKTHKNTLDKTNRVYKSRHNSLNDCARNHWNHFLEWYHIVALPPCTTGVISLVLFWYRIVPFDIFVNCGISSRHFMAVPTGQNKTTIVIVDEKKGWEPLL